MKVLVAQRGARRHYAVPVGLHRNGALHSFVTDWCSNRGMARIATQLLAKWSGHRALVKLRDRQVPEIESVRIRSLSTYTVHMAARRWWNRGASQYAYWADANRAFGESVVRTGFGEADTVYAFNGAALEIFQESRRRGLRTILDQTMAPWSYVERLLAEERALWPDWDVEPSHGDHFLLADREAAEWELADTVVCGSQFVVDTLRETRGAAEFCRVVPYGYDCSSVRERTDIPTDRPLRVLFVGTVELRKGVPYLLKAVQALPRGMVEVRVVGPIRTTPAAISELQQSMDVCGPVPRSQVVNHYRWADVFVLPTLAEGSANVCYEAMSHGLPVITTPNAGSLVRDRIDGLIIAPRSSEQLAEAIHTLNSDRSIVQEMGRSAGERLRQLSTTQYANALCAACRGSGG